MSSLKGLRPRQREGAAFLCGGSRYLAWEQRIGKTRTALAAISDLIQEGRVKRALVVCPAIVRGVWEDELIQSGIPLKIQTIATGRDRPDLTAHIHLVSWDLLYRLRIEFGELVLDQVLILDEAHRACNPTALRWKGAHYVARRANWVWLLSGTPYVNSAMDLYWQLKLLGGINPYLSIAPDTFGKKYCYERFNPFKGPQGGMDFKGLRNENRLMQHIGSFYDRRLRREELPGSAQRFPQWLGRASIDTRVPEPELSLGKVAQNAHDIARLKAKLTVEYIDSEVPGRPLIIFGWHRDFLSEVAQHFEAPILNGSTPAAHRENILTKFRHAQIPVLCCQIRAAGVGINLSRAREAVFGEVYWSAVDMRQAEDRLFAADSEHLLHYVLCRNTVDEDIWDVILGKGAAMDRLDSEALLVRDDFLAAN